MQNLEKVVEIVLLSRIIPPSKFTTNGYSARLYLEQPLRWIGYGNHQVSRIVILLSGNAADSPVSTFKNELPPQRTWQIYFVHRKLGQLKLPLNVAAWRQSHVAGHCVLQLGVDAFRASSQKWQGIGMASLLHATILASVTATSQSNFWRWRRSSIGGNSLVMSKPKSA